MVSGSYDSRIKFWTFNNGQLQQIGECVLGWPVWYLSVSFPLMVVATAEQLVFIWDLNKVTQNVFEPVNFVKSTVSSPSSAIACFSDGKGYMLGAVEGRACVRNVDLNLGKFNFQEDFIYKCHRKEEQ